MKRRVFYSFHYKPDSVRAGQVRNIGAIEGNEPASDNGWEAVKKGGDPAIKRWIAGEMRGRSCTVVLVGENTADRKWINHEILKSWNDGMAVVGIRIHGLRDFERKTSKMGLNPFDFITHGDSGKKLSTLAKCYNPGGRTSQERYSWITEHLANAVEEAIKIRNAN